MMRELFQGAPPFTVPWRVLGILNKSFEKPGTNGKCLIPFAVNPSISLRTGFSNALKREVEGHELNQLVQGLDGLVSFM
jgi:hypothetical protein